MTLVTCPACHGSGCVPDAAPPHFRLVPTECRCCGGLGKVRAQRVCPDCGKFRGVCKCRPITEYEFQYFNWEHSKTK